MVRFLADACLHAGIVSGCRRREPMIDFVSANEAGLDGVDDPDVLDLAAREDRIVAVSAHLDPASPLPTIFPNPPNNLALLPLTRPVSSTQECLRCGAISHLKPTGAFPSASPRKCPSNLRPNYGTNPIPFPDSQVLNRPQSPSTCPRLPRQTERQNTLTTRRLSPQNVHNSAQRTPIPARPKPRKSAAKTCTILHNAQIARPRANS